jgi:serine/threonine-protein kinase HipA
MRTPMQLDVLLGSTRVGTLRLTNTAPSADRVEFLLDDAYLNLVVRPVLGQTFEDDPSPQSSAMRAPPWFSNLLPESPLRQLIAEQRGVSAEREFFLLHQLGADLPGAVVLKPSGSIAEAPPIEAGVVPSASDSDLKFSLAGVQLKFSMLREGKGLTFPATGVGGDWIVKFPGSKFEAVVENEFSMMTWARAAGVTTADFELAPARELRNLPPAVHSVSGDVFATRRYDRSATGRIHQEDFAQVLGVYPAEKYRKANTETVANLYLRLVGTEALTEFVRRLVFVIASGNEDAHLKNWSLVYPGAGTHAAMAPAYDLVSTIQYDGLTRGLGLNLAGSKVFERLSRQAFIRLGKRLGVDVLPATLEAIDRTLGSWHSLRTQLPIPARFRARLDAHLASIPLLRGE